MIAFSFMNDANQLQGRRAGWSENYYLCQPLLNPCLYKWCERRAAACCTQLPPDQSQRFSRRTSCRLDVIRPVGSILLAEEQRPDSTGKDHVDVVTPSIRTGLRLKMLEVNQPPKPSRAVLAQGGTAGSVGGNGTLRPARYRWGQEQGYSRSSRYPGPPRHCCPRTRPCHRS